MTIADLELTTEIAAAQALEEAAHFLDLEPWISQRLHQPERDIQANLQIRRDDGSTAMLRAVRVQHSSVRGPYAGPVTISKAVSEADLRGEAMSLSWQWALWGLPFGGAAAAITSDVEELSENELKQVLRCFTRTIVNASVNPPDIVTPARALRPQLMGWCLDRNSSLPLHTVTGKPAPLQGVPRQEISGLFVRELVCVILRSIGTGLAGKHIALVGFGTEAQAIALELERAGSRIFGICDASGAIHHRSGLNVEMLQRHCSAEGVIYGYPEAEAIALDTMLNEPCDILIIADGERMTITPRARMVVEVHGSCAATLPKDTMHVPRELAGFGLLFADYLEWRKSQCGMLSDFEMKRALRSHIKACWTELSTFEKTHAMPLRRAAVTLGISRVAEALRST